MLAGIVVALAVVGFVLILEHPSPAPTGRYPGHTVGPPPPPNPTSILLSKGTEFSVKPNAYVSYKFSNNSSENLLVGMFDDSLLSCPGCAGPMAVVMVVNETNYRNFTTNLGGFTTEGPSGMALYVENGSLFSTLRTGTSYLVFWNNAGPGASLNWTIQFSVAYPFEVYAGSDSPPEPSASTPLQNALDGHSVELGGSPFSGAGPEIHSPFELSPEYWSWNLNGSFSSSGGAVTLQIDQSGFGFEPIAFALGPSSGVAFNLTLPPGTYDLTLIDSGYSSTGCAAGPPWCPTISVSVQSLVATPT